MGEDVCYLANVEPFSPKNMFLKTYIDAVYLKPILRVLPELSCLSIMMYLRN